MVYDGLRWFTGARSACRVGRVGGGYFGVGRRRSPLERGFVSVVAVRVQPAGFSVAADSITVRGYTQRKDKHAKLVSVNDLTIGSVGLVEESAMFQIFCMSHQPKSVEPDALLEFVWDFSSWKKTRTDSNKIENSYMLGIGSEAVYCIDGFLAERVKDFEAIGAGMDYALSALHLGRSVVEAVETAIELSVYCEGPVKEITR